MPVYYPPSSGSTPAASETVSGIAEIATSGETTTGTDDVRIVTPLKAKAAIDARLITADYQRGLGIIVIADDRTSGSMPALSARDVVIEY